MENLNERKFNSLYRKKIVNKINKLKEKKDFIIIFNIIQFELGKDKSINRNGIFFNINMLSDKCIEELDVQLCKELYNNSDSEIKIKYQTYNLGEPETNYKLSNQEKSILKKISKF
jgi:hypothetical protein